MKLLTIVTGLVAASLLVGEALAKEDLPAGANAAGVAADGARPTAHTMPCSYRAPRPATRRAAAHWRQVPPR